MTKKKKTKKKNVVAITPMTSREKLLAALDEVPNLENFAVVLIDAHGEGAITFHAKPSKISSLYMRLDELKKSMLETVAGEK
jgi:hypothetical protein